MKMFISYRRDDSAGYAGRLFDYLSAHFGASNVFMDIDTIEPGEDFRMVVSRAMGTCDVVLVMIGKQWLNIPDTSGGRRLDDPRDLVRMEVGAALSNRRIRVIPVLVRDAGMPGEPDLPEGLKELAWRNAIELSDSRFQHDVRKLIGVIERLGVSARAPVEKAAPAPKREKGKPKNWLLLAGIPIVVGVLALLIWMLGDGARGASPTEPPATIPAAMTEVLPVASTSTIPVSPTLTVTVPPTDTSTPEPSPTATQPELTSYLVQLVDDYHLCINNAVHDRREDYELCWNMLSDRPGEFQDFLNNNSGGQDAFINSWNTVKLSYALYYCFDGSRHSVLSEFYYHPWNDLTQRGADRNMLEYRLAEDHEGWRITGAFQRSAIGSHCESQPRVDRLALFR